jgi:hypothetical protein
LIERLEGIRMSESEREQAKAYLHQGECFAQIVVAAAHNIRLAAAAAVQRGAALVAPSIKRMLAKPARTRRRFSRMASP